MTPFSVVAPRPLILYQAPWNWDYFWSRAQPLAQALSEFATVIYVDSATSPLGRWHKLRHLVCPRLQQLGGRLYRLKLHDFNALGIRFGHANTNDYSPAAYRLLNRMLQPLMRSHRERWLLLSRPTLQGYLGLAPWDRVLVDIEDPWLNLPWSKHINREFLAELLSSADHVFVNGSRVAALMSEIGGRTIDNLPNGISREEIARFEAIGAPPPWLASTNRESTIVFTGQIDGRLDLKLLDELTARLTDFKFCFVGTVGVTSTDSLHWQQIASRSNVLIIPRVDHREIPNIISAAGTLVIPYAHQGAELMFPAKFWEYLATSRPICTSVDYTTDFPELKQLAGYRVCHTTDDWLDALRAFRQSGNEIHDAELLIRREICAANSWRSRALALLKKAQSP